MPSKTKEKKQIKLVRRGTRGRAKIKKEERGTAFSTKMISMN